MAVDFGDLRKVFSNHVDYILGKPLTSINISGAYKADQAKTPIGTTFADLQAKANKPNAITDFIANSQKLLDSFKPASKPTTTSSYNPVFTFDFFKSEAPKPVSLASPAIIPEKKSLSEPELSESPKVTDLEAEKPSYGVRRVSRYLAKLAKFYGIDPYAADSNLALVKVMLRQGVPLNDNLRAVISQEGGNPLKVFNSVKYNQVA